ncbi:MAG: hypothetical protein H0V81_14080 [Solirubrobacterales bacterium]|nr:hypothetical protein [Solirubrobacterales bacterium]
MSAQGEFERALRRAVPPELQGLDDGLLEQLTVLADAERVRRDEELRDSLTEALKEIPLPLRGVAKRAVIR